MFSRRRSSTTLKPLWEWTSEDTCRWLAEHNFHYLIDSFKSRDITGQILSRTTGQFIDELAVPSAEERERLLTSIFELKALSPLRRESREDAVAPVTPPLPTSSVIGDESRTHVNSSPIGRSPWKRSLSFTPESSSRNRRISLHASVTRRKSAQQLLRLGGTRSPFHSNRSSLVGVDEGHVSSLSQGSVKVYGGILRREIEYKTVALSSETTAKELVEMVLEKYDVTTRDPNLYYIAMEKSSSNRRETRSQTVVLDDEDCPLVLQTNSLECAFKFHLRARDGRLVKVHGSDISPGISYKSVYIAEKTNARELTRLISKVYSSKPLPMSICLCEVSKTHGSKRPIDDDELPLELMDTWKPEDAFEFHLLQKETSGGSYEMISSVSLGDSGVEQDIQKEHANTAMTSEDVTDSLQKAQSYLSLTGMSVGSVDTFSPTHQDFDYDLSAGRLRLEMSRFGTPDLVPLGHVATAAETSTSESAVAPTVVSLADLSQLRVRPDNIMNIVEEDEDENGDEDTETIKSTSDTEDVFLYQSPTLPSSSELYSLLEDFRLFPLEIPTPDSRVCDWGIALDSRLRRKHQSYESRRLSIDSRDSSVSQQVHSRTSSDGLVGRLPFTPRASLSTEPPPRCAGQIESVLYVKTLLRDSPLGGELAVGDVIVEINGLLTLRLSPGDAMTCLQNSEMSTLRLVIGRRLEMQLQGDGVRETSTSVEKKDGEELVQQVSKLEQEIAGLINENERLLSDQEILQKECSSSHERVELSYGALRELSQDIEALQQQQMKRHREMEERRKADEEQKKRDATVIGDLRKELAVLKEIEAGDALKETCKELRLKVFQLEANCLKLEKTLKSEKMAKTLLSQRLKNEEEKCRELERISLTRGASSGRLEKLEEQLKHREDLIGGLNAALVQLQRSRSAEVGELERELMHLRKSAASIEANLTDVGDSDREALAKAVRSQKTQLRTVATDLQDERQRRKTAEDRADQLAVALKNKYLESDRRTATSQGENGETAQKRLDKLTALVLQQAPEILHRFDSEFV